MLRIFHASDLQCGKPYLPEAAQALVRAAHKLEPDVIVISGDLTQRAKPREFATALEVMQRLPDVPRVVTPGNHDVPLYRVWERALTPYWNWKRFIARELNTVTSVPGATLVALNSSAPRSGVVGGRVHASQLAFARRAFNAAPEGALRLLVIHHHFMSMPDGDGGRPIPGAVKLLEGFEKLGIDAVLGGHIHRTHVMTSRDVLGGDGGVPGVPLIAAGTATSRRARKPEIGMNSLNVVTITDHEVEILPYLRPLDAADFEPTEPIRVPRHRPGRGAGGTAHEAGVP